MQFEEPKPIRTLNASTVVLFPNGLEFHLDIAAQAVLGYNEKEAEEWLKRLGKLHADKVKGPQKVIVMACHIEHESQFGDEWWDSLIRVYPDDKVS
ncbi:hypothetical protein ACFWGB_13340 [Bacillus subtilis]